MDWLFNTMQMIGWAVIVNVALEAYHVRRANEEMGDYDFEMEPVLSQNPHRAG